MKNFWEIIDEQENEEEIILLSLKSGKEFKVKVKNIANYDDDNAEIELEGNKDGYFILDVSSVEFIDFIEFYKRESSK